jgi:OCT family organic cation transporter-like MFS transporter 4/5
LTNISNVGFMLGEIILTLEAYLLRDWVHLQVAAHAPLAVGLLLWFVVPESARWLVANGRGRHAKVVLASMARINGRKLDLAREPKAPTEAFRPKPRLGDLLRPRPILLRTVNMSYQWASVTMTFYGLLFSLTSLSGDPYLNFLLGALLELPGILFSYFCTDLLGRRWMLTLLQGLAGVACIGSGLLDGNRELSALQTCFALMGRFATTAGFGTVYLYAAELYPTAIRNAAMGVFSTFARVGGIVALLLGALSSVWPPLPMVLMGAVSILACGLAMLFPETTGQHLPETVQDALDIDKNSKFRPCSLKRSSEES